LCCVCELSGPFFTPQIQFCANLGVRCALKLSMVCTQMETEQAIEGIDEIGLD
jgi:hypothetical protein